MKEHEMTEWDAGQILIKLSDDLNDAYLDLARGGYLGHATTIIEMHDLIRKLFNNKHQNKSHTFGL